MVEYYVFEEQLRNLVRRADSAGYTRQAVFEALIELADQYQEKADAAELEQIIADQIDPSNPRYDYGLV